MKVLVIGYNHTMNDKRVLRTVKAFKKIGKVFYQYSGSKFIDLDNVEPFPLEKPKSANKFKRIVQRRNFDKAILKLTKELDYDVAYFHSFSASLPIKIFKEIKNQGKKLIFSLHEIYPEQFLSERFSFIKPLLWNMLKKEFIYCDAIVTVSNEAFEFMINKTKVSKPSLIIPNLAKNTIEPLNKTEREKRIVIVGGTQRKIVVDNKLIMHLRKNGFSIVAIGMNWNEADKNIPFLAYNEMMGEISRSAFSLISFQTRSDHFYPNDIYSLPNKFFDSLAAGTPVIVEDRFISMKKIINSTKTGIIIDFNKNAEENIKKILFSWQNYSELLDSIKSHQDEFVWNEKIEKRLINFISDL